MFQRLEEVSTHHFRITFLFRREIAHLQLERFHLFEMYTRTRIRVFQEF
jgi:hypothetical protein